MIKFKKLYVLVGLFILLASSSLPALSVTPMSDTLGESFSSNFGLVFDLNAHGNPDTNTISTNVQVLQDLGNSSNPKVNPVDQNPNYDQQFFFSNIKVGGVNNIYLALQKIQFNVTLNVLTKSVVTPIQASGSAPYQTLLQYFQNNGTDVLVANTFRGLIAYTTNSTDPTLDSSDQAYFGYSFVESHFLQILNDTIHSNGFPYLAPFGSQPIYNPSTNTFGMNYTNYLVVWQNTASTAPSGVASYAGSGFDNVATGSNIVAASLFKYLSFTYHVEQVSSNSTTSVVKVTTNYDLGPMEWLMTKDSPTTLANIQTASTSVDSSNSFNSALPAIQLSLASGAVNYVVNLPSLSFYTGTAVQARIDASAMQSAGVDGMGIAVASSTNAIVVGSTVNAPAQTTNSQNINIPLSFGNKVFFKTDFAGKSTYTRTFTNGTTQTNLPVYISTRSMANLGDLLSTSNLASTYFQLQTAQTIGTAIYSASQLSSGFTSSNTAGLQVDHTSYATFVQMPKWSGLQVTQDPSFSAVSTTTPSGTSATTSSKSLTSGVPGFEVFMLSIAMVPLYILRKRKKSL